MNSGAWVLYRLWGQQQDDKSRNWRAERRFSVFPAEMLGIRLFLYSGLFAPADGRGRVCTQIST